MHLNWDPKFSPEIFGLYLDFMRLTIEKVDSHTQVFPNVLRSFPITKLSINRVPIWLVLILSTF